MSTSLLTFPPEIILRILELYFSDPENQARYGTILLIHPQITALCRAYEKKAPFLLRTKIMNTLKCSSGKISSFPVLAVYACQAVHPNAKLPESVHDITVEALLNIDMSLGYLQRITSWVLRNIVPLFEDGVREKFLSPNYPCLDGVTYCLVPKLQNQDNIRDCCDARIRWEEELLNVHVSNYTDGRVSYMVREFRGKILTRLGDAMKELEVWEKRDQELASKWKTKSLELSLPELGERLSWEHLRLVTMLHGLKGLWEFMEMMEKHMPN